MKRNSPRQEAVLEPQVQEGPLCKHHWIIDRPAGPVSKGVCRSCGEVRQFQNYFEGSPWGYDIPLDQLAGGSRYPSGVDVSRGYNASGFDEERN